MPNLSIKSRLYLLSIVPLFVLAVGMLYETYIKMSELGTSQTKMVQSEMLKMQKDGLKAYVEIVDTVLSPLKEHNAPIEQVIEELSKIEYGESGYFFGYSSKGVRIFSGDSTKGIGDSFWSAKDSKGNYFIQDIIKNAKKATLLLPIFFPNLVKMNL